MTKRNRRKSDTTHIICILDRSSSMGGQVNDVITNFNKFLEEQQGLDGKAELTLVLFDDQYEMVYDKLDIKEVPPLTEGTYFVRGMTAMNDAIGRTLNQMQRNEKAIVLIHTDGWENASREYSAGMVKTLVDKMKKKWEFIFVGGDIDAKEVGNSIGIARTANVFNDAAGTGHTYANFSNTTSAYRHGGLVASANVNLVESTDEITLDNSTNSTITTTGNPLTDLIDASKS